MTITLIAIIHLLGLMAVSMGIFNRYKLLKNKKIVTFKEILTNSMVWYAGLSVLLVTGLHRFFSALEKGSLYYLKQGSMHGKLTLILTILILEAIPLLMILKNEKRSNLSETQALTIRRVSFVQLHFLMLIVAFASFVARGY